MPTEYTSILTEKNEITFEEFALRCARAFGACISMRDESLSATLPNEFEPSLYHEKKIKEAEEKYKKFKEYSEDDFIKITEENSQKELKSYEERIEKNKFTYDRYFSKLKEVENWEPPTKDHENLKEFMIEQIKQSIDFDVYEPEKPVIKTAIETRNNMLKEIIRDIEYHTEEDRKDKKRTFERNKWIKELRNSLK